MASVNSQKPEKVRWDSRGVGHKGQWVIYEPIQQITSDAEKKKARAKRFAPAYSPQREDEDDFNSQVLQRANLHRNFKCTSNTTTVCM